jgi:hypothetical protein
MTLHPTIRQARKMRHDMVRFFRERGLPEFAERVDALRKDPRFNGAHKAKRFRSILDDYAAHVTKGAQAPEPEAAPHEDAGNGGVAVHAAVAEHDPRDRPDAGGGVSNLEAAVVGDD